MTAETLQTSDYRRMFGVLDGVAGAVGEDGFYAELSDGLGRHLGWSDLVVVDVPAELAPFPPKATTMSHLHSNRPVAFLEEYIDRWHTNNPFKSVAGGLHLKRHGYATLSDLHGRVTPAEWSFVDRYLRPHGVADVLEGIIGTGGGGAALVCAYAEDAAGFDVRQREIMQRLCRHLAPWVRDHQTRVRGHRLPSSLTAREGEVAELTARGLTNRQIAQRLGVTVDTVKKHLTQALAKTGCASRTQLALLLRP